MNGSSVRVQSLHIPPLQFLLQHLRPLLPSASPRTAMDELLAMSTPGAASVAQEVPDAAGVLDHDEDFEPTFQDIAIVRGVRGGGIACHSEDGCLTMEGGW